MRKLLPLIVLAFLVAAAPASARIATPLEYDGFIDGSDATGVSSPSFDGLVKTQIDESTGAVYATTSEEGGRIYKYNDKGEREYMADEELAKAQQKAKSDMDEACKKG